MLEPDKVALNNSLSERFSNFVLVGWEVGSGRETVMASLHGRDTIEIACGKLVEVAEELRDALEDEEDGASLSE